MRILYRRTVLIGQWARGRSVPAAAFRVMRPRRASGVASRPSARPTSVPNGRCSRWRHSARGGLSSFFFPPPGLMGDQRSGHPRPLPPDSDASGGGRAAPQAGPTGGVAPKVVTVYASSSSGVADAYKKLAYSMGEVRGAPIELLARRFLCFLLPMPAPRARPRTGLGCRVPAGGASLTADAACPLPLLAWDPTLVRVLLPSAASSPPPPPAPLPAPLCSTTLSPLSAANCRRRMGATQRRR